MPNLGVGGKLKSNFCMKNLSFIFIAFVLLVCSCTQRLVDFTVISTKNIPITEAGTEFKKATQRVQGVDKKWQILFIPAIPNMKEAIDKAIEKYPGAIALTDGVVYSKTWSCGLFGQSKYIVEGTPLYTQSGLNAFNQSNNSNYNQSQQNINQQQNYQQQDNSNIFIHEVKKGETLEQIAKSYGVTMRDLIKWNKLSSTNLLSGTKLQIQIK